MSPAATDGAARYARTIERRWAELQGRAVVLSPRDWARIALWHERGIPLAVVEEALSDLHARGQGRRRAPRLAELEALIEEAWALILDGRRASEPPGGTGIAPEAMTLWRKRLERESPDTALATLLRDLLARQERGEAIQALDDELDRCLLEASPPELRARVERQVELELQPFRGRMRPEQWEATRRRARLRKLRRALQLPHLAQGSARP